MKSSGQKAADRNGFKYTWATEHHVLMEYSHVSANESFLGYMTGQTERVHLGSGIFDITPPVNHPARIAERAAMLDHLSKGRFEFGIGRGSSTTEQRGFGIHDPDIAKEMLDEMVTQFKHMWREASTSSMAASSRCPAATSFPSHTRTPHPPMWVAAGNPETSTTRSW
jgi:alkanesulfonate monooxygenase SsuD/methylene tetrahydromethanopterin reductase-like flavin-dependent oxidoreductase (luciferase family)